jgi:hypothetical protein
MRAAFLHLDDALDAQGALLEAGRAAGAASVSARDLGPALRLWSRPPALDALRARLRQELPASAGAACVFAGSGDFHHVSPMLLARALEAAPGPVTVIHFDNHPDWVKFRPGLHCGSWVGAAARQPGVKKVLTIGVCSDDIDRPQSKGADLSLVTEGRVEIYAWRAPRGGGDVALCGRRWPTIEALGEAAAIDLIAARVETPAIYVTLDKDVLRGADAITNWDQGRASLAFVTALTRRLAAAHKVIGADIVGDWSSPHYGGGLAAPVLKQGEALLDQPWRQPDRVAARRLNEGVNLQLLALFAEPSS